MIPVLALAGCKSLFLLCGCLALALYAFTGKASYSAGSTLPEAAEDMSDVVSLVTPHETPLLDLVGDSAVSAKSTLHEWMEDSLNSYTTTVSDASISNAATETAWDVAVGTGAYFRAGDIITHGDDGQELMQVTGVAGDTLTVVRNFGGSTNTNLVTGQNIMIVGNAELEGADAAAPQQKARVRKSNYCQIFAKTVEISGSEQAIVQAGLMQDEFEYQKKLRTIELLGELERTVIWGRQPAANPQGSATVRRYMNGLISLVPAANKNVAGSGSFGATNLTDADIRLWMKKAFDACGVMPDTMITSSQQRYKVGEGIVALRTYLQGDSGQRNVVRQFETDFGVIDLVTSRWMPISTALLFPKARVQVSPLVGRSFQYRPFAPAADKLHGQIVGEYTLEYRNPETLSSWRV